MTYKVFGANASPFVRKVRVLLAEKGLDYELESVNPFAPPEGFRRISPLGKIPGFQDGDKSLADSTAICIYIERCNPQPALYPSDNYQYARALWFEEYMDSAFLPIAGPEVFRPLVMAPIMMKQEVTPEIKATALEAVDHKLAPMWDYLERELGANQFFVNDTLSIADIAVASAHVNLWHAGVEPDAKHWPRLGGFLQRMRVRPSLAALIEEESKTWNRREANAKIKEY